MSTLLYCMGEGSEDIMDMSGISDNHKKEYDRVHREVQRQLQGLEKHHNYLRGLASIGGNKKKESLLNFHHSTSGSRQLRVQMIRDRLVVGIRDKSLSERLQMEANLMLDKAKKLVRQWEAVK